jgi:hypothetical protein
MSGELLLLEGVPLPIINIISVNTEANHTPQYIPTPSPTYPNPRELKAGQAKVMPSNKS